MALRRLRNEPPRLTVIRGRGRPRAEHPDLLLDPDHEERLRAILRVGFKVEGPYLSWFLPADHERFGDELTELWLAKFRASHPSAWRRMLRNTRHAGSDAQGGKGTAKGPPRRYALWRERTAKDKSERDVSQTRRVSIDPATTGGSASDIDANDYCAGDLEGFHYDSDSFSPEELLRLWGQIAATDLRYHYERAMERLMTEAAAVTWAWSPPARIGLARHGGAWLDPAQRSDADRDLFRETSKRLRATKAFSSLSRLLVDGPHSGISKKEVVYD